VLEDNPVIELVKLPVPVPSLVLLFDVVGFCEVLQHTPRTVTDELPCDVTFPPLLAEFVVMFVIAVVVTVGAFKLFVVKLT
jgi:hypothetical protein